jgi:hypothetical protein
MVVGTKEMFVETKNIWLWKLKIYGCRNKNLCLWNKSMVMGTNISVK